MFPTAPPTAFRTAPPLSVALTLGVLAASSFAGDWSNAGGNSARNGLTSEVGPESPTLLWSGGRPSLIAWQPVTEGNRAFLVRQASFIPSQVPNDSPVVAMDLDTGAELWATSIPYNPGDWTTWIAGVDGGRVYACRGGNGATSAAKLYALDASDGSEVWSSTALIDAGAYDGVVFAPDGDPVIGSFTDIWRIDAADGSTVWQVPRSCSVTSSCGVAIFGSAVYAVDAVPGGHAVCKYDLATGALLYAGPLMPGFLVQNTPLVGPDGTVYFNRVQNNPATDFFYAFDDTGTALVERWSVPAGYNTSVELAVGPDGSVYHMAAGDVVQRLDPSDGSVLDFFALPDSGSVRMATDALGRVFVSNGEFSTGRVHCFDADLTERWSVPVTNVNIGAPALGRNGTLVVAGVGTDVRAYRNPLAQDVFTISAAAGGTQTLELHAPGSPNEAYWVVGSVSGTSPGFTIAGVTLPLNFDAYFDYTLNNANSALLVNTLGFLDGTGRATAQFALPAGAVSPASPLTVNHAFAIVDFTTATATDASNASTLSLVP